MEKYKIIGNFIYTIHGDWINVRNIISFEIHNIAWMQTRAKDSFYIICKSVLEQNFTISDTYNEVEEAQAVMEKIVTLLAKTQ